MRISLNLITKKGEGKEREERRLKLSLRGEEKDALRNLLEQIKETRQEQVAWMFLGTDQISLKTL